MEKTPQATNLMQLKNLRASFATERGRIQAVDQVSFSLSKGQTLGIVGESGCGKTVTALSLLRLLPQPAGHIDAGEVLFKGTDLLKLPPIEMTRIRGGKISMIFQEPMTALNPVHTVGKQLLEMYALHRPQLSERDRVLKAAEMLKKVGIPAPAKRLGEYPHQLSGGMRQRVMIALALACEPELIIADEPTTALDVTIQAQILEIMKELQSEVGMAIILITHDLGVVSEFVDHVMVMYAGVVMEQAPVNELFNAPRHPYTKGLLNAIPTLDSPRKTHLPTIEGTVPQIADLPRGCRFQNRCPHVQDRCKRFEPQLEEVRPGHLVRCVRWREING